MDMRKKILYVITKSVWGGAQQYVYDLAINLPKDRFDAVVAGGGDGLLFEKLRDDVIRTIRIPGLQRDVAPINEIIAAWRLLRLFIREQPHVIHLSSSKAGALGALAAKIASLVTGNRLLIIFTIHGWGFNENRPFLQRSLIFCASWITSIFCDRIILISTSDYIAAARFIPKRKLTLIPHGLAPIRFLSRKEARLFFAQKTSRPIAADSILIGALAELTRNKGLFFLISAFSSLLKSDFNRYRSPTSIGLIILGEGEDRTELEQYISAAGLQQKIFLPGFIPGAAERLRALDIFVLPSVKEGLPYALMQAMAAGLAVVATRVGGIPDLVGDGQEGLLVPAGDPTRLKTAIAALISSPELREKLGTSAQRKIATKFPFHAMITETISMYDAAPNQ